MLIFVGIICSMALVMYLSAKMQQNVNRNGGCPECGMPVPRFRRPTSFRQAVWGGWTCSECGTEMDRYGKELIRA